jgi:hypothetical protein
VCVCVCVCVSCVTFLTGQERTVFVTSRCVCVILQRNDVNFAHFTFRSVAISVHNVHVTAMFHSSLDKACQPTGSLCFEKAVGPATRYIIIFG